MPLSVDIGFGHEIHYPPCISPWCFYPWKFLSGESLRVDVALRSSDGLSVSGSLLQTGTTLRWCTHDGAAPKLHSIPKQPDEMSGLGT